MKKYRIDYNGFNYIVKESYKIGFSIFSKTVWRTVTFFWNKENAVEFVRNLKKLNK